jgi:hypothetical protein
VVHHITRYAKIVPYANSHPPLRYAFITRWLDTCCYFKCSRASACSSADVAPA